MSPKKKNARVKSATMNTRKFRENVKKDPEKFKQYKIKSKKNERTFREKLKKDPVRLAKFRLADAERQRRYRLKKEMQKEADKALAKISSQQSKLSNKECKKGIPLSQALEKVTQVFENALPKNVNSSRRSLVKMMFLKQCLAEITDDGELPESSAETETIETEQPMEVDNIEVKDEPETVFYDNVDDAYCRCCFKIFIPSIPRHKISETFLTAFRETFQSGLKFVQGSWVCASCYETVVKFKQFRKNIIARQASFSMLVANYGHEDLMEIQKLSEEYVDEEDWRTEEILIKEETTVSSVFAEELPVVQETGHTNTVKRIEVKKAPIQDIHVIPKLSFLKRKCKDCGNSYQDLLGHRIKFHSHKQVFRCSFCDFKADSRAQVMAHIRNDHAEREEKKSCHICGKLFHERFIEHHVENVHNRSRNFFCDLCPFSSYKRDPLLLHMQNNHLPKQVKCQHCDFTTINKSRLRLHIKNMHEENRPLSNYQCPIEGCKKVLKKKNYLDTHLKRVHLNMKNNVKCKNKECKKAFYCASEMMKHFRQVHAPKDDMCHVCGKCFGSQHCLKTHVQRQHGEKLFQCSFCDLKFRAKTPLTTHIKRYHTFEKDFKCDEPNCSEAFYVSKDLHRHIEKKHLGIKFKCQVSGCESCLGRKDAYVNHLKSHKELTKGEMEEMMNKLKQFVAENNLKG